MRIQFPKNEQILHGYIKEPLLENKKKENILNHEKVLKELEEKVMVIFYPLTRSCSTMEEKRNVISENDKA